MKTNLIRFPAIAFVAAALTLGGAPAAFADTTTSTTSTTTTAPSTTTTTSTGWHHRHHHHGASVLTDAEKAQLHKAKEAALAANPSLKQERHALKQQYKALAKSGATKDEFKALRPQKEALHQKMRSAELLIDPSLSTVFAKIDAAKASHKRGA